MRRKEYKVGRLRGEKTCMGKMIFLIQFGCLGMMETSGVIFM